PTASGTATGPSPPCSPRRWRSWTRSSPSRTSTSTPNARGWRRSPQQLPPDDLLHDLVGAAEDRLHPRVEVGLRDRVLEHVAVAAVQLHAAVHHPLEHV